MTLVYDNDLLTWLERLQIADKNIVAIERKSKNLAIEGKINEARELFFGDEYASWKEEYTNSINNFVDLTSFILTDVLLKQRSHINYALLSILIMLPILLFAYKIIRKYGDETFQLTHEIIESNSLLAATLESIDNGILVVDIQGKIISYNQLFLEMWRIPKSVINSKNDEYVLEHVLEQLKDPDEFLETVQYLYNHPSYESNDVIMFNDGRVFERYSKPQKIEIDITGRVWCFRDVTEKKQLEEQLQIRQKMDSLGTLAGGIAHDFNNLLTGIIGGVELLKSGNDNFTEHQKGFLDITDRSCTRAANLIRQFQTLSKGVIHERLNVDIYDIADEVFNFLKETTDRLIAKEILFKKGEYFVNVNSGELYQVLVNLATNSVHAIEECGISDGDYIRINAQDSEVTTVDTTGLQEGSYIHIVFEDNGAGMSEEVLKKAFDPMFTTKSKSSTKGQGLGLSMVYNIITKLYNGHVSIESKKGIGTTFHLYFPKVEAGTKVEDDAPAEVQGGSETILVVDDETIVLETAKRFLEKYGYAVIIAIGGKEALDIYENKKDSIAAVILDLSMPHISGKEVFQRMLKIDPELKVIISSGYHEEYSKEGILSQAIGNLSKPYTVKDMARTIRNALDS